LTTLAQDDVQELEKNLEKATADQKPAILNELAKAFQKTDSKKSEAYALEACKQAEQTDNKAELGNAFHNLGRIYSFKNDKTKSITFFRKAYNLRKSIEDHKGVNQTAINIGTYYMNIGKSADAKNYFEEALEAAKLAGYARGIGIAHNQLGNINNFSGQYEEAIKHYQESLHIFEEIEFDAGIASTLNNIGFIYQNLDKKVEALAYFKKALTFYKEKNNTKGIGEALNNCGNIYGQKTKGKQKTADLDSAIYYFNEALKYFNEAKYKQGIVSATTNIGLIYMYTKDYTRSLEYLNQSLAMNKELNNIYELSAVYKAIGLGNMEMKNYGKALEYFNKGLKASTEMGFTEHMMMNNKHISEVYDSLGNYKTALAHLKTYIELNEDVRSDNMKKVIQEMETKYETEKKEQQLREANQKSEYQQKIIWGAAIGGAVILIFAVLMLIQFIQKKRANTMLVEKNEEILLQKEEIETQRDEIEAQRDQVEKQKDLIEDQQKGIMDSIHYARRIQEAILPQRESFEELNPNCFVLFKPRDIVSGDFYWMGQNGNKNIIIAADCTGHGVPGAFMSMLGTAFLNEITSNPEINTSAEILNNLRDHVITSLKQTGKQGEQKDGMDLALYQYDKNTLELDFAGANNPLFIIRKTAHHTPTEDLQRVNEEEFINTVTDESYTLIQVKADKMPIGIYSDFKTFESVNLRLQPGDSLYTFSDGYVDQFGGPKGKKYLTKRFKKLLVNLQHIPIIDHELHLDKEIEQWRGDDEQIDDIIVIGLQV